MPFLESTPRLRFLALFALMASAALAFLHAVVYPSAAFDRYLEWNALLAVKLLGSFGFDTSTEGPFMRFDGLYSRFERACDVSQTLSIYTCAVVAFPNGRRRLAAIAVGVAVVESVNVTRVATLLCIEAYRPAAYDVIHLYVWPVVLLGSTMLVWFAWARRSVEGELR